MRLVRRSGQGVIIATLIMVAASALLTTLMLYWGLSLQGQGLQNFGGALFRSNSQAAEEISIDSVFFTRFTVVPQPTTYTAMVYVRNFGDNPLKLASITLQALQSGISPASYRCEVTTSSTTASHLTIVARSAVVVSLYTPSASISTTSPGCKGGLVPSSGVAGLSLSGTWDGLTISIQVATEQGTVYSKNFAVPSS